MNDFSYVAVAAVVLTACSGPSGPFSNSDCGKIHTYELDRPPNEACVIASGGIVNGLSPRWPDESCDIDSAYMTAFRAANPSAGDGGIPNEAGTVVEGDAGGPVYVDGGAAAAVCPSWSAATVHMSCHLRMICTGRYTDGQHAKPICPGASLSDLAHAEAAAVVAFERMARELTAHGAPAELVAWAKRAADEERRHVRVMAGGDRVEIDESLAASNVRTLLEIAEENAREGCVREAYGAVLAVYAARHATDAQVAAAMAAIAEDECGHAALSRAVHAWAMQSLAENARASVEAAWMGARDELLRELSIPNPRATAESNGLPPAALAVALAAHVTAWA